MTRAYLDHSLLSPNGRISPRVRKAEMDRVFGGDNLITSADLLAARLKAIQPTEAVRLRRQAATLRSLAAGGMRPRANLKTAEALEARAAELDPLT